jgi:hypothetical protein
MISKQTLEEFFAPDYRKLLACAKELNLHKGEAAIRAECDRLGR